MQPTFLSILVISLWQKLAFEQDEYGNHRIVTVRTQGTSDDNNHDKLDVSSVYLKISSDTKTIASYYSIDKKRWNHGSSIQELLSKEHLFGHQQPMSSKRQLHKSF